MDFEKTENLNSSIDLEELINQRDEYLPKLISSFNQEHEISKLLKDVTFTINFLGLYDICDIENEIFVHLMPVITRCVKKSYQDNISVTETCDDDLLLDILKQNLQVSVSFLNVSKTILEYILKNNEVDYKYISSVPINIAQSICSTFEHCKNSQSIYKNVFDSVTEIMDLFRANQEVHLLFLKVLDSCVIIHEDEVHLLNDVLEVICDMSELLSQINIKSMADNWKGYTSITQKFSDILKYSINLGTPIKCLSEEIYRNLSTLNTDGSDLKTSIQTIKVTSFLLKVTLKCCDTFWDAAKTSNSDVIVFTLIISSFPVNYFRFIQVDEQLIPTIETCLIKVSEPFVNRITKETEFLQVLQDSNFCEIATKTYPRGFIIFFNNLLKTIVVNETLLLTFKNMNILLATLFDTIKMSDNQFFYECDVEFCLYEELVLNITAIVLLCEELQQNFEEILLSNILQDNLWCALLAVDVWCLLLRNSDFEVCWNTLEMLVRIVEELNIGMFTSRIETVYLKMLLQRIFVLLPENLKYSFCTKIDPNNNLNIWKFIEFSNFPVKSRCLIEDAASSIIEKLERFNEEVSPITDFLTMVVSLETISTVNFTSMGLNPKRFINKIEELWEFSMTKNLSSNNIFKLYFRKLCKITKNLINEYNSNQLITILKQLKIASQESTYKLSVCEVLSSFASKNVQEFGQEQYTILSIISTILYPNLLIESNPVLKQKILELVNLLYYNTYFSEAVKSTLRNCGGMQKEILSFLESNSMTLKLSENYLNFLSSSKFQHECIEWSKAIVPNNYFKFEEDTKKYDQPNKHLRNKNKNMDSSKCEEPEIKKCKIEETDDDDDDDATEVLRRIKAEIACLTKVFQKEPMTAKHVSEVKILASKLQSLI